LIDTISSTPASILLCIGAKPEFWMDINIRILDGAPPSILLPINGCPWISLLHAGLSRRSGCPHILTTLRLPCDAETYLFTETPTDFEPQVLDVYTLTYSKDACLQPDVAYEEIFPYSGIQHLGDEK
jgi:hypothetical protein